MSAKHTPGPWATFKVGGDNGTVPQLAVGSATTRDSILTITDEDGTVFAAVLKDEDAHLIAAAPELLEALAFAIRFFDQLTPSDAERMRKVLEKAGGAV